MTENKEHMGTCIYEKGRFELRETDNAIIDLKGDFPPIMIASNIVDDGSEPNCADKRSVLHLLNELADNNPNEERHWYLKKMLDKAWEQSHELKEENEQLNKVLKIYRKVSNCGNCHYHNYDWFDDGDEFEVCDKGNDISDRICVDWEEL